VEGGGKGRQPEARDAAVGGQHTDDAAEGGRLADAAAGVGAERGQRQAGADGGGAAAARSARHALAVAGVAGGTVAGVFRARSHGELVAVGLADQHRTGGLEARHGGGVELRNVVFQDARAAGGAHAAGGEHVLDGDGRTRQRGQGIAAVGEGIDARGLLERPLAADGEEAVQVRVAFGDGVTGGGGGGGGGGVALGDGGAQGGDGWEGGHQPRSMILGTSNRWPAWAGALASAARGAWQGVTVSRTASSRRVASGALSTRWAVGGTSLVGNWLSSAT